MANDIITTGDITVAFTPHTGPSLPGKLADAELQFTGGLFDGLRLIGFTVWQRRGSSGATERGLNVTFPARSYSINGERRSFALLRPQADVKASTMVAQEGVRDAIVAAYAAWVAPVSVTPTTVIAEYWYRHRSDTDQSLRRCPQMSATHDHGPAGVHEEIATLRSLGYTVQRATFQFACARCQGNGTIIGGQGTRRRAPRYKPCPDCDGLGVVGALTEVTTHA